MGIYFRLRRRRAAVGLAVRRLGRRPALLAGLCTGLAGTLCAAWAPGFEALLAGRFVQALGLATCSITTQTMLRDRLQGEALTRCFIMLGAVLSWSPALGPLAGQLLADQAGFAACWAASRPGLLLAAGWAQVGETRTAPAARQPMLRLARRMLRDPELLCTAMLVAGLNLLAFYAAGPFMTGPLPWLGFGWIGMAVALAGTLGALWNRRLPAAPRAAGGAGPVLRGGRRGGAGIGDLARAHARPLVGRGRAAHLRRLRHGHPQPAGAGAATLRRLPGPGRRAVQPGLLQPAGAAAGGDVVAVSARPALALAWAG